MVAKTGLEMLTRMNETAPGAVWLGAALHRRGDDRRRLRHFAALAREARARLLATNDVHAHAAERRPLQDVLKIGRAHV